jgi:hypothetical protein
MHALIKTFSSALTFYFTQIQKDLLHTEPKNLLILNHSNGFIVRCPLDIHAGLEDGTGISRRGQV